MTDTAASDVTQDHDAEARRIAAVRRFKADQGKFPGVRATYRTEKLAELEADDRAEEAAGRARNDRERAVVNL